MDRYRGIVGIPLLEAKIAHLVSRLQSTFNIGSYQTQEEIGRAYADIAARLERGSSEFVYDLPRPKAGAELNPDELNLCFLGIFSELLYLIDATKGSANLVESNYNFAAAAIRDLQSGVKRIRQQLAVYSLYTTGFGNSLFFGESFSNEDNLDRGSSFLREKECFVDLAEGTVSLPKKTDEDKWKIDKIEIGSLSNGVLGNNVEARTPVRGTIGSMTDDNVDTWTEYERVTFTEDEDGLRLELKISLDDVRVVNRIRVHPVLLGARTPPSITAIEVSEDGRSWISLKGDVSVATFMGEKPEDRFHLSPHSARFSGEFNVTFAPRFTKFIRLFIRQTSSFPIEDVYGVRKLRYAVGIREIAVYGSKFESAGEIVSKQINMARSFSAASIISLIDPPDVPPEVGGAEYYLSFNDGATWQRLLSQEEASTEIPEVLYPDQETSSFRWKIKLFKDELAFRETTKRTTLKTREVYGYPDRSPHSIRLAHKPKSGTITICDPSVAGRGRLYPKMQVGNGVYSDLRFNGTSWERHGNTEQRIPIPLDNLSLSSEIVVYVNNLPINRIEDFNAGGIDHFSRVCIIKRADDGTSTEERESSFEIVFGNGDGSDPKGFIPSPTDTISLCLKAEWMVIEGLDQPYRVKLDHSTNGSKKDTKIRFYGTGPGHLVEEVLPSGVTKRKLTYDRLYIDELALMVLTVTATNLSGIRATARSMTGQGTIAGSAAFVTYKQFKDGSSELISAGDWTVDPIGGYLYTKTPIDDDFEFIISYFPDNGIDLTENDWDFVQGKLDEIQIYDSGYHTVSIDTNVSSGMRSTALASSGIVPKSMKLSDGLFGTDVVPYEVPYINGVDEFEDRGKIQDEEIPTAVAVGATPIAKFRITHYQTFIPASGFTFLLNGEPSTTFVNEVPNYASLSSTGDFYIDTNGLGPDGIGYIYVVLASLGDTIPSSSTVAYHYRDIFSSSRMRGSYSVDSKGARIFFSERLTNSGKVYYKYAPYKIRYIISKELVEGENWRLEGDGRTVTLNVGDSSIPKKISVQYEYDPETVQTIDLAPYYSPLLRALAVKVA